ncbi:MAG: dimethylsulfonioproprionate lyase family protein [Candidatus Baltobacteraceae bacterium]
MKIVNTKDVSEDTWTSPKGKFGCSGREVSEALGRIPTSMDMNERHPFDVEISRVHAGKANYPYHSHSAQWEFYHVISGSGFVRHEGGMTEVATGDAFLFKPGEAHQLIGGTEDLVVYVVADNPIGESGHYPDSNKWIVRSPERQLIRGQPLDYHDGEE